VATALPGVSGGICMDRRQRPRPIRRTVCLVVAPSAAAELRQAALVLMLLVPGDSSGGPRASAVRGGVLCAPLCGFHFCRAASLILIPA